MTCAVVKTFALQWDRPKRTRDVATNSTQGREGMKIDISELANLDGFIGACVVDSETALTLTKEQGHSGFDLDAAAAGNTEVVRAKHKAMKALKLKDSIEDILITLGTQYHLIRPLAKTPSIFIYLALDKKSASLGMARVELKKVEELAAV